jgi:glycosyltransferase involved in cell wall biosynthesis
MNLAFFEYVGQDPIVADFIKGPSSRFTNIYRNLSRHYGVEVSVVYSNPKRNAIFNLADFTVILLTLVTRLVLGSMRHIEGIYTAQGRSWLAGFLAKTLRPSIMWLADVNDTARNEVATEVLKEKKPVEYYTLRFFKKTILFKADFIVGSSYNIDELLKNGYPREKSICMQDGANVELFTHGDGGRARELLGLRSKIIVLYDGKLLYHYHLENLLSSFTQVRKLVPNSILLIVGDGPALRYLECVASALSLGDSAVFTGLQPYEMMPDIVSAADVCVLPFSTVGLQLWEWLAAGKIVVAIESANLRKHGLSHLENCVFVDSPSDLAKGITFALSRANDLSHLRLCAASLAKKIDWKILVGRIYEAIQQRFNKSLSY